MVPNKSYSPRYISKCTTSGFIAISTCYTINNSHRFRIKICLGEFSWRYSRGRCWSSGERSRSHNRREEEGRDHRSEDIAAASGVDLLPLLPAASSSLFGGMFQPTKQKTGEYMSIPGADFYRKVYPEIYHWTLEKDKQYILLHEEVISCDELQLDVSSCETLGKAVAAIRDEKLCVAKEIAKKFELNLLYDIDIKQCLTDFVYSQSYVIHIDQTREMYLRLLNEDFQKRIVAGDESLLIELDRKYKSCWGGVLGIRHSLQCFRDLGGLDVMVKKKKKKKKKNKIEASTSTLLCQKKMEEMILDPCQKEREKQHANWIKKIKEVIEGYCKQRKESYIKTNGFVDYLRLKIEIAKEIGIVIKDGEVWREKGWEEFRVD